MKDKIYFFSQKSSPAGGLGEDQIGRRGVQALELAALDLPILPGFIIDASEAGALHQYDDLADYYSPWIRKCGEITGKNFNDSENPMLVKIVISPSLALYDYPVLHNFGLADNTLAGFIDKVGEDFAIHEYLYMIRGLLEVEAKIKTLSGGKEGESGVEESLKALKELLNSGKGLKSQKAQLEKMRQRIPADFFRDAESQLEYILKRVGLMLSLDEMDDNDVAVLIQPMVYGNYGKDSAAGIVFTRDVVTGENRLTGDYHQNQFNTLYSEGKSIEQIDKKYFKILEKSAHIVENYCKDIRSISFTIEKGNTWLIDQRPVVKKSTRAEIQTYLDLYAKEIITAEEVIQAVKPEQLNDLLHPVTDSSSVKGLPFISGGLAGAPGSAIGRVFFSTEALLDHFKTAQQQGEDTRTILCLTSSFAEDVKAIEVASGVLSSEGGYSAHASVVARQYGKVSLVNPDLKISGAKAVIGGKTVKEGDYLTLEVPQHGDPVVYFGEARLIEPDFEKNGLLDFVKLIKTRVGDFHVRVNADKPKDAELALKLGAEGIGLCRTEHMFFDSKRINVFREMIVSDTEEKRKKVLGKLKAMQKRDFYDLLKAMAGKEVTIRLLDAPLHEFLPHNKDELNRFLDYLKKQTGGKGMTAAGLKTLFDGLKEFNPMLGHRGCRIAVSYPEIYGMQVEALFEAAYDLKSEKVDVRPEIMVPLIMNKDELKMLVYGKRIEGYSYPGLVDVEKRVRTKKKARPLDYKIGTMVELPAAALNAGEIARYAQFFSFGTNDLTQTTLGLSRDDFNSFMPDYTLYDILEGNPFRDLTEPVKELVQTAVRRGTMTRPDLSLGLCGEHGAVPENIRFCRDAGLSYVSCSLFSLPIANLAVAQMNLE